MPAFKDDFANRIGNSSSAKQAMLEKFKKQPKADDPEVQKRMAEQLATARAREDRAAQRKAEKESARLAREAELKQQEEERIAAEKEARRVEGEKALALLAEQKAARDARYAARKDRLKKGK